jgi:predicted O-methyltransferase YrrM
VLKVLRLPWRSRVLEPAPPQEPPLEIRPLTPVVGSTATYSDIVSYFAEYPPRSVMSDHSRAVLFSLIRMLKATAVAEVGTMYAGTTEVMARAMWENGQGVVYTADPLGADRCPQIIARWPQGLRDLTRFHALSSMDFFHHLDRRHVVLDLALVDGNHEYEFALFDLLMAAKLLRPGGIVVMDNAEQTGPFKASQVFLRQNPGWRELGDAIASHDPAIPFNVARASIANTSFILLQAPDYIAIGADMRAWGQISTKSSVFEGMRLELPAQSTSGTLHYQAIFRAFLDDGSIPEAKRIGRVRLEPSGLAATIAHSFTEPMRFAPGAQYTTEVDLSWEAEAGASELKLAAPPTPF